MYFLLKMRIFHCYVCLPEGNSYAVSPHVFVALAVRRVSHPGPAWASISLISVAARPLMTHLRVDPWRSRGSKTGGQICWDKEFEKTPPKNIGQKTMKQRLHEKWMNENHSEVTFKSGGFWRCIPTRWSSRFTDGKAPSSDTDLRCAPKKVPSSDVTAIVFEHEMFKWMDHELRKKTNKTQVGRENSEGSLSWMCDINQWISTAQLHTFTARCPPRQEGPQGL